MIAPCIFGFPVTAMGRSGFKSNDTRRRQNGPHLKCSPEHVAAIFGYLRAENLDMYRPSSDLPP